MLRRVLESQPHQEKVFDLLLRSYHEDRNYDSLIVVLRAWVEENPADSQSAGMLIELESQLGARIIEPEPVDSLPDTTGETDGSE